MRWYWVRIVVRKIRVSLYKTENDPQRQREGRVKMGAKIVLTRPHGKEHLEPPAVRRGREGFSPRVVAASVALLTP